MSELNSDVEPRTVHAKILTIRGQKVILDADMANIYGVETRFLNEAVRRNSARFPVDFMFSLTRDEELGQTL